MAINRVDLADETLIDISDSTVNANNLMSGEVAYMANGERVEGSLIGVDVIDNLASTSSTDALSANQGRVLNGKIEYAYDNGYASKNLLDSSLGTTTQNGVTCTALGDGTYKLNGTATTNTYFGLQSNLAPISSAKIVGCPNGGGNTKYSLIVQDTSSSTSWTVIGRDNGNGSEVISIPQSNIVRIAIYSGQTVSDIIFKPMIVDATIFPDVTYEDYEPYTKSNLELSEEISDCYGTDDSASTTIEDTDYIPLSDASGNKKKSLWTTLRDKFWTYVSSQLASVATSGSYNDLSDKPTIPDVSTKMDKENPSGTGSFSMNRHLDSDIGEKSATFGDDNYATANQSFAEGKSCKALGNYSHAEGYMSEANVNSAHCEGSNGKANGYSSHTEGSLCISNGSYSHSEGFFTIATAQCSHVQGKYNIEDTESKYAHIVGNGNFDNRRSNAHTIDWEGNAWFAGDIEDGSGNKLSDISSAETENLTDATVWYSTVPNVAKNNQVCIFQVAYRIKSGTYIAYATANQTPLGKLPWKPTGHFNFLALCGSEIKAMRCASDGYLYFNNTVTFSSNTWIVGQCTYLTDE